MKTIPANHHNLESRMASASSMNNPWEGGGCEEPPLPAIIWCNECDNVTVGRKGELCDECQKAEGE